MTRINLPAFAFALAAASTLFAQRDLKNIPDPDPAAQAARLKVADGFELTLYASDPMLAKPIHMNFDTRGRLWVASSSIYPQIKPGEPANDKIIILEDTDRDGKADRSTDFAGGLLIPTAVLPDARGGAYVGNSTELLHFSDDDGDGKADRETIALTGFGTEDTHHILHTLRWGFDGRIYFNQSIYIHSHIETPHGVRRLGGGGIWQFRPETWKLEILTRGMVNSWGHHYDPWGQQFGTDGAYGEGINYLFPGAVFATAPGAKRILHGLNPGQPKECGLERISGRHLPESMRGQWVTCDFRGNRVVRFELSEDRSGYASRQVSDLVWTDHIAFRPIDVKMGPDGAIYVADWYNPIIQHGEVDFRDDRRDRVHGRIWRLSWKDRPALKLPEIPKATDAQLLEMLKAEEDWVRLNAKLELKARKSVEPVRQWIQKLDPKDANFEHHRLEGLWALQSMNHPEPPLLEQLLQSPDHRVRAAAVRVLQEFSAVLPDVQKPLQRAIADSHPRVRLEAVHALRSSGSAADFDLAMQALDAPLDDNLDFSLWLTARETSDRWLPAFQKGEAGFAKDSKKVIYALKAIENPAALKPLVAAVQNGSLGAGDYDDVLGLLADQGDEAVLQALFLTAGNPATQASQRSKILRALERAATDRKKQPSGDAAALTGLLSDSDTGVRTSAFRLAGRWKSAAAEPVLIKTAEDSSADLPLRQAALEGLSLLGSPAAGQTVRSIATGTSPDEIRQSAVIGLLNISEKDAAETAVSLMNSAKESWDGSSLFEAFARSKTAPAQLAAALKDKKIPAASALLGMRKIGAMRQDAKDLLQALQTSGGLEQMAQQLDETQLAALVRDAAEKGNPHRGEIIYRRPQLACTACHAIGGAGSPIGPDLVSIGASAPVDYLIESILDPNKKIKEGYHTSVVTTTDGQVIAGTIHRQTDQELVLRDATGTLFTLRKDRIQNQQLVPVSLMPVGLTTSLRKDEFIDLVAFLSRLGKEGDFKVTSEPLIRSWRMLSSPEQPVSNQLRRSSNLWVTSDDSQLLWTPVTTRVSGQLSLDELPVYKRFSDERYSFIRAVLQSSTDGKARITLDEPRTIEAWLNQTPLDLTQSTVNIPAGRHRLTLAVDRRLRTQPVRMKLEPADGSTAKIELLNE